MFFKNGNQSQATLEHQVKLDGMTVVESWIVESEKDKSRHYGLDVPVGTWMVSMKVESDAVWQDYVKDGKVRGFSIEAFFSDRMSRPKDKTLKDLADIENEILVEELRELLAAKRIALVSYNDYPKSVQNNAKRGIEMNDKVNNKCATQVGKVRASTLAKKGKITVNTIKRMYSYLSRAETYYDPNDSKACGTISYLLWGGKAALGWSRNKLRELGELELETRVVNDSYAIIDDRLAYSSEEKASEMALKIGCEGYHTHELEGKDWFMPCETHELKAPCTAGYEQYGMKRKGGKLVPNCIPIK